MDIRIKKIKNNNNSKLADSVAVEGGPLVSPFPGQAVEPFERFGVEYFVKPQCLPLSSPGTKGNC